MFFGVRFGQVQPPLSVRPGGTARIAVQLLAPGLPRRWPATSTGKRAEMPPRSESVANFELRGLDLTSVEELRKRKRAMATGWNQVVLPVGGMQD